MFLSIVNLINKLSRNVIGQFQFFGALGWYAVILLFFRWLLYLQLCLIAHVPISPICVKDETIVLNLRLLDLSTGPGCNLVCTLLNQLKFVHFGHMPLQLLSILRKRFFAEWRRLGHAVFWSSIPLIGCTGHFLLFSLFHYGSALLLKSHDFIGFLCVLWVNILDIGVRRDRVC